MRVCVLAVHICMRVCVCVCSYINIYMYVKHAHKHAYIYMCVCVCVCIHIQKYILTPILKSYDIYIYIHIYHDKHTYI
jgi:hypothetical protein